MLLLLLACRVNDVGVDAALDPDGDGFGPEEDCAPMDAAVYPGAEETWYDGVDQDCSGGSDYDQDRDGFTSSTKPNEDGDLGTDCDDQNEAVYPNADEVCDGHDNNCDGSTDEGLAAPSTWYTDADHDGYGGPIWGSACAQPAGAVTIDGDCNDSNSAINPSAAEVCNTGLDEDCSGDDNACSLSGDVLVFDANYRYSGTADSDFGYDLTSGDWNDDGHVDLAISAVHADNSAGKYRAGRVYVVYGPLPLTLTVDLEKDAVFEGVASSEDLGTGIGSGDLNGDGVMDLLMGAPGWGDTGVSNYGAVDLVYGGSTWPAAISATSVDARFYSDTESDGLGYVTKFIGDVDGDGHQEIALGAPAVGDKAGAVYIVPGNATRYSGAKPVSNVAGVVFTGDDEDTLGGRRSVGDAFDLNGDGFADIAMGADKKSTVGNNSGGVYLIYGDAAVLYSGAVSASGFADATFQPTAPGDSLGEGLDAPRDVDGDGYDDLMIGAAGYDDPAGSLINSGGAFLICGSSTRLSGDVAVTAVAVATVTGVANGDYLGGMVSGGDLNNDGLDDIVISARGYDHGGVSATGAAFVFYGPVSGVLIASEADALLAGPSMGFTTEMGDSATLFDANGDGILDVFIGASGAGMVYGYLGSGL